MLTSKLLSLPTASSLHTTLRTDEPWPFIVHGDGAFVKRLLLSAFRGTAGLGVVCRACGSKNWSERRSINATKLSRLRTTGV
jgi:hypothetical protein